MNDEERRTLALSEAIRAGCGVSFERELVEPEKLLAAAKLFEAYLKGEVK